MVMELDEWFVSSTHTKVNLNIPCPFVEHDCHYHRNFVRYRGWVM